MIAVLLLCVGAVSASPLPKIIGGDDVDITDHSHQVSLTVFRSPNTYFHICGGSIIAKNWVLTAAHCVNSNDDYFIQTNHGSLKNVTGTHEVQQRLLHPNFHNGVSRNDGAYPNDIALLRVNGDLTQHVHEAMRLPSDNNNDFSGAICEITGWGNTATDGSQNFPDQLQWTNGKISSLSECSNSWSTNYNHDVHICIGGMGGGSCQGDSGGPMICDYNGQKVLAGVTSWGVSGCRTNFPSVYARVSNFLNWIKSNANIQ